ncbi:protein SRG1 [Ziziphus jujuba]|uniref:Protein SRG1 n=1 Tax=Ziziphus jujuba TaxID=326968 RepID=A0ABM3I750_ZIZJJ|nr:protein SRG1 [Ziziphus jujuba]
MGEYISTFGSSLLVPSVQELAKDPIINVPSRYLRPDQDPTVISDHDPLCFPDKIPAVDYYNLISGDSAIASLELEKLHLACKDWGFFQLVNHGISSTLVEKIKTEVQCFFNLPMEEKQKFWQTPGEVEGFGQAFVVSEEQKLDWNDIFFVSTLPVHTRKPHLFPKLPSPFRETLETYSLELKDLAMGILEQIEKALKVKAKEVTELFEGGLQSIRTNYYPPCPQPEQVIGLTPHSDAGGLTILLQVSEVEGLQIKKDGIWVPVKPLPGAFIVNVGDALEIITIGAYRSIEHRATINSEKERLSIATFYSPRFDGEMGPAYSLITEQSPQKYRRIGVEEFFRGLFSRELDRKSYLDSMKL